MVSPSLLQSSRSSGIEVELLLTCARATWDTDRTQRIDRLLENTVNWDNLLALASRHYVTPLLHRNLAHVDSPAIPDDVRDRLRQYAEFIRKRNQILSKELLRLLHLFEASDISVIPYKGPVIAALAYGDISLREFGDLDFLVRRRDLSRVLDLLHKDGYRSGQQYTAAQKMVHEQEQKEYCLLRYGVLDNTGPVPDLPSINHGPPGVAYLEPHWSLTARRFPFPIDYEALWQRAVDTQFLGAKILSFSPEDLILILSVCGCKSKWKRLLMVCDVAETIRTYPQLQWDRCLEHAHRLGSERILILSLLLASELLGEDLPQGLAEKVNLDRKSKRIYISISRTMFRVKPRAAKPAWQFSPLLWSMRERSTDKLRYFFRTVTTPRPVHVRRIPLPNSLFPLYRLIVPIHDYVFRPVWHFSKYTMQKLLARESTVNK